MLPCYVFVILLALRCHNAASIPIRFTSLSRVPVLESVETNAAVMKAAASAIPIENYETAFEAYRPISKPVGAKPCILSLMKNKLFANDPPTYSTKYTPPTKCGNTWSLVTLTFSVNIIGVQYDRSPTILFDNLLILKTTTAEPTSRGIKWSFDVDVTRFTPFLKSPRTVNVSIGNYVTSVYTGVFNASLVLTVYPGNTPTGLPHSVISLSTYSFTNGSDNGTITLRNLPKNIYRAEIELVQVSGGNDEFYWLNYDDSYVKQLPDPYQPYFQGGGIFRETQVYVDSLLAGTTWQFPVIFTGGINPYWWSPVVGIGAFLIPRYTIDITPFVGRLVDGKSHAFKFAVKKPLTGGFWQLGASLHLWLDKGSKQTSGTLLQREIVNVVKPSVSVKFDGTGSYLDGSIKTIAARASKIQGTVKTSFGTFKAVSTSYRNLYNLNVILNDGNGGAVTHNVKGSNSVKLTFSNGTNFFSFEESFEYPRYLAYNFYSTEDRNYVFVGDVTQGFNFNKTTTHQKSTAVYERQRNAQYVSGSYSSFAPGYGYANQMFNYKSNFQGCYSHKLAQYRRFFDLNAQSTVCT